MSYLGIGVHAAGRQSGADALGGADVFVRRAVVRGLSGSVSGTARTGRGDCSARGSWIGSEVEDNVAGR